MSYEINISKNGKHFFATNERSIGYDNLKLRHMYNMFLEKFPESEGYEISVSKINVTRKEVKVDTLKENYVLLTPVKIEIPQSIINKMNELKVKKTDQPKVFEQYVIHLIGQNYGHGVELDSFNNWYEYEGVSL